MASSGYQSPWIDGDDPVRARRTRDQPSASPQSATSGNSPPQPTGSTEQKSPPKHYGPRTCRICLEVVQPTFDAEAADLPGFLGRGPSVSYVSEDSGRLFRPCLCNGTQKYVHEGCLDAWRYTNPTNDSNYWQCPTCRYRYRLGRMSWARWISGTASQVALTILVFVLATFALGFVADPIINLYLDPVTTLTTAPSDLPPRFEEAVTWTEHFAKGFAGLGLVGFAKFLFTANPITWLNVRQNGWFGNGRGGHNGRDRLQGIGWITLAIGIGAVAIALWKAVRALCRRALDRASERVMEVPIPDDDIDETHE